MEIDFEFKKERKLGDIVQDFINLLRLIFPHFIQTTLRLALVPLCGVLVLLYYITLQLNVGASVSWYDDLGLVSLIIASSFVLLLLVVFFAALATEYFILLKTGHNTDFDSFAVWHSFLTHAASYLRFFLVSILALLILAIPVLFAAFILMFIPLVGSFLVGILFSFIGGWFLCAFLFYREGYAGLFNSIPNTFGILRKRIVDYSVSAYIVSFVYQALLLLLTLMPGVIIALIAYNTIGFDRTFFDTMTGRMLISIGGSILVLISICYYMLRVFVWGIIYETAKEITYGEDIYQRIADLGKENDAKS